MTEMTNNQKHIDALRTMRSDGGCVDEAAYIAAIDAAIKSLAATAQQPVAVDGAITNEQAVKARRPIMQALRDAYAAGESRAHFNYGFLAWRVVDRVAAALRSGSQGEGQA